MAKFGVTKAYRYYADRFYLDRANRDTYLARQAAGDLLTSGHLYLPTKLVKGLDTPSADGDAARKKYVDDLAALYLLLTGGTLSGNIAFSGAQTVDGVDISAHVLASDAHVAELLAYLMTKGMLFPVTTTDGWTSTLVGTGAKTDEPGRGKVATGTTANSSSLLLTYMQGLGVGKGEVRVDWDKKLYITFRIIRVNSDAEAVARIQLKEAASIGALGAKGLGLQIDNLALSGESYGTSVATVDLVTSLTGNVEAWITIIHDPDTPKIEWYVNGVLKGTQSTAAKIPSGGAGSDSVLVLSIANGATGTVEAYIVFSPIMIWQEA